MTTKRNKRERKIQILAINRLAKRLESATSAELKRVSRSAKRQYQEAGTFLIPNHRETMERILRGSYTATGELFIDRVLSAHDINNRPGIADAFISNWVSSESLLKSRLIADETIRSINSIIQKGIEEGLSQNQIAKSISDASGLSPARSKRIARTEVHTSAQASSYEAAQAIGGNMGKVWVASGGARTRRTHNDADGQKVPINDTFIVGGERLRFPGDPSGSARETINCRCAAVYEIL